MSRRFFGCHRLRGQILGNMFLSFIIAAVVIVIGTIVIYAATTDLEEAETFIDYVVEKVPTEIDNIEDIEDWEGWESMNEEWRVEVYNDEDRLVYTNGKYIIMPDFWMYTERHLDTLHGRVVINSITSEKTGVYMELFRLFDLILFVVIFSLLFRKTEKYTYEISDGISILAGGEMNHRIPIKGKNELAMIASNINGMAEALQVRTAEKKRTDKERDDMITNLAHDIRTPITVLEGYLSMLITNENIAVEKRKEYLNIALDKCNELSDRADNIFEFVRLSNKKEDIELLSINAKSFVYEKFEELSMMLSQEGFELDVDIDLDADTNLRIDKMLTQRVFDNLLSNIIKYADKDYKVSLKAYIKDSSVEIALKNKSKEKINIEADRLFDRTISGDSSRNSKSEGLGLAICRLIMDMQGGRINATLDDDFIVFKLQFLN